MDDTSCGLHQMRIPHTSSFQYDALAPGSTQIRLLTILVPDSRGTDEANSLKGFLAVVDLAHEPIFYALSYVWGIKDNTSHVISVNEQDLKVTENCYQALLHLRQRMGSYRIWVDAVCINQQNPTEQMYQVGLMGKIYSEATEVFVWLGPGTTASGRALACLSAISYHENFRERGRRTGKLPHVLYRFWHRYRPTLTLMLSQQGLFYKRLLQRRYRTPSERLDFFGIHKFQQANNVKLAEMAGLLQHDWLERIWTYQEALLSKNLSILKGAMLMNWQDFSFGIFTLDGVIQEGQARQELRLDAWIRLILDRDELQSQHSVADSFQQQQQQIQSITPLNRYRRQLSVMPRDRIKIWATVTSLYFCAASTFSVLGFVLGGAIEFTIAFAGLMVILFVIAAPELSAYRIPAFRSPDTGIRSANSGLIYAVLTRKASVNKDYSHGVRPLLEAMIGESLPAIDIHASDVETYRDLAVHMLRTAGRSDVLLAAASQATEDCPSWVPAWAKYWSRPLNEFHDLYDDSGLVVPLRSITMDSKLSDENPNVLCIRGIEIASISAVYPSYQTIDIVHKLALANSLTKKYARCLRFPRYGYRTFKPKRLGDKWAYWRDFVKFYLFPHDPDRWHYHRLLRSETEKLRQFWRLSTSNLEAQDRLQPSTPTLSVYANANKPGLEGEWVLFGASQLNDLAGNAEDLWDIGAGKIDVEIGDRIVLLSGVSAPLIVRVQTNGGYKLVSPARRLDRFIQEACWDIEKAHEYPYLEIH